MRKFLKFATYIFLLVLLVMVVGGIWKKDEIKRLLAVNSLFSEDKIVHNFSHMKEAFLYVPVPIGDDNATPLPVSSTAETFKLSKNTQQWIVDRNVTSLAILKDGELVYENYFLETKPDDLRISWSVAKSFLSALMGVVLQEGHIASIDDQVTKYVPSLVGTAYDGATIKNVLQMSSGVTFNEDYLDKKSDINRMGREVALGGTLDGFAAGLKDRFIEPGKKMQYVSIDTHVIGMVIRGATGRSIPELLSEKIMGPLGLEKQPYYVTDGDEVAFVLGGLNLTTRDYARFGQMIIQDGLYNGQQIVPKDWIRVSTDASAHTEAGEMGYGYQWWIPSVNPTEGEFFAHGVYGQYIYINRPLGVVIATNGADRGFKNQGIDEANIEALRLIANGL